MKITNKIRNEFVEFNCKEIIKSYSYYTEKYFWSFIYTDLDLRFHRMVNNREQAAMYSNQLKYSRIFEDEFEWDFV